MCSLADPVCPIVIRTVTQSVARMEPRPSILGLLRSLVSFISLIILAQSPRPCPLHCGLKHAGYSNPSTEASLSRSMSGPLVPSILPSSTYEEVRNIGREFVARQQRKKFNRPRREKKLDFRRALLPSNASAGSGQAEDVNSSIDSFTAQSSSSFDNTHYGSTPMDYPINSR